MRDFVESFLGLAQMGGLLILAALLTRYAFRLDQAVLLASYAFLGLYVVSLLLSPVTGKDAQVALFHVWNALTVVFLVLAAVLYFVTQRVPLAALAVSALFQLPYMALCWYQGGLAFTHKFG